MPQAVVIRHVAFEDLGNLRPVLEQKGYQITYKEAGIDDLSLLDQPQPDLLIVLGGPIGVYDEVAYPFIKDELKLLTARLAQDLPTLGICLGCQLMARALGAAVYPGGAGKEIGWGRLQLTSAGYDSPLRHLIDQEILHWHGDTFDLPTGAVLLASSPQYPHQAFSWGKNALGVQFHPEVTPKGMERWFIGHACEIGATPRLTVPQLRDDTLLYAADLQPIAAQVWQEWLGK